MQIVEDGCFWFSFMGCVIPVQLESTTAELLAQQWAGTMQDLMLAEDHVAVD